MIEASEKTIALKTPIKSCGEESARCSGSSLLDPRSVFSISIPPFTTPSNINDISSLGRRFGSSEPKQPPGGKTRLPSAETGFDLADFLRPARYRDNAFSTKYTSGNSRTFSACSCGLAKPSRWLCERNRHVHCVTVWD